VPRGNSRHSGMRRISQPSWFLCDVPPECASRLHRSCEAQWRHQRIASSLLQPVLMDTPLLNGTKSHWTMPKMGIWGS
jgi:hypothetical protein